MLGKLLIFALVVAGVIAAVRLAGVVRRAQANAARRTQTEDRQRLKTEDLLKCPTCGAYSAAGSSEPCDRADCPKLPGRRGG